MFENPEIRATQHVSANAQVPEARTASAAMHAAEELPAAPLSPIGAIDHPLATTGLPQARVATGAMHTTEGLLPAPPLPIGAIDHLCTIPGVPQTRESRECAQTQRSLTPASPFQIEAHALVDTPAPLPRTREPVADVIADPHLTLASLIDANERPDPDPALAGPLLILRQLQRTRRFCITSQQRIDRSTEQFVALQFGLNQDDSEAERRRAWSAIVAFRRAVERNSVRRTSAGQVAIGAGGPLDANVVNVNGNTAAAAICIPIILTATQSRSPWDSVRREAEREMRRIARTLPAWSYVESIRGLSDLGLAIILAETGDLSLYQTKERVWKRLGLAVIDGQRQRRVSGDDALRHGFAPQRRAEIWSICSDAMVRHQIRSGTDGGQGYPVGIYGAVYYARKTATADREGWTLAHRDNDARRIMTKAVIENVWRVWSGLSPRYPEAAHELWEAYGNPSMQQATKRPPLRLPRSWTTIATRTATDTRWINVPDSGLSSNLAVRLHENARINLRFKTVSEVMYMQAKRANREALGGVPSPIMEFAE